MDPGRWSKGSFIPPFETKLFHFHREFSEKSEKFGKNQVQATNQTPLCILEPPYSFKEILDPPLPPSGSKHGLGVYWFVFYYGPLVNQEPAINIDMVILQ